jgi:hypothetical protein
VKAEVVPFAAQTRSRFWLSQVFVRPEASVKGLPRAHNGILDIATG